MFRRRKACASEYKASLLAILLSTPSATQRVARPSSKRDSYIVLLFNPLNICKILPRRRGSGSDVVDDEGVEKQVEKQKVERKK